MSAAMKWTIAIVGLLVANMLAMVILIIAARSTPARVIPDYYDKAVHYNDTLEQAERNQALGWTVDTTLAGATVETRVRDSHGAPVTGAVVTITSYARATQVLIPALVLVETDAGHYEARLSAIPSGIQDLAIDVTHGATRFTSSATLSARGPR